MRLAGTDATAAAPTKAPKMQACTISRVSGYPGTFFPLMTIKKGGHENESVGDHVHILQAPTDLENGSPVPVPEAPQDLQSTNQQEEGRKKRRKEGNKKGAKRSVLETISLDSKTPQ